MTQQRSERKNALGKVSSVTDEKQETTTYRYDPDGNVAHVIDPLNNVLSIDYDARGRKRTASDTDLGQWSYEYDGFGNVVRQTDAKDLPIVMTYDELGRMTTRTDSSGTAEWVYDLAPAQAKVAYAVTGAPDDGLITTCATIPSSRNVPGNERALVHVQRLRRNRASRQMYGRSDLHDRLPIRHLGSAEVVRYPAVEGDRFAAAYDYSSRGFLHFVTDDAEAKCVVGCDRDERARAGDARIHAKRSRDGRRIPTPRRVG